MRRILIIGCSGGGKSTLARKLGERLSLPVTHLDKLWWQPGWVELGHEAFLPIIENLVAGDGWVIDGNYSDTFPMRLARADTVIWIERSRLQNLIRAFGRFLLLRGTVRPDVGEGCPEKFDLEFARYIWNYNRDVAPRMEAAIREFGAHVNFIRLRSDTDIANFLETL
ncbi:MAG: topology modulation protein [Parvibaculaceae bacterium]|nr:topology modulation protein [Parvibaculaceae bacterium]